jgi:hypothetical protein
MEIYEKDIETGGGEVISWIKAASKRTDAKISQELDPGAGANATRVLRNRQRRLRVFWFGLNAAGPTVLRFTAAAFTGASAGPYPR